jgi:hypothetical protein
MMVTSSFCFVSLLVLACVSSFASQAFGYYGLFCPIDIDLTAGDYDPCFDNIVRPLEESRGVWWHRYEEAFEERRSLVHSYSSLICV